MQNNKTISYAGKDFGALRRNLINFTKQYFPNSYTDFNESSPGMIFIELAAYVGDVLFKRIIIRTSNRRDKYI